MEPCLFCIKYLLNIQREFNHEVFSLAMWLAPLLCQLGYRIPGCASRKLKDNNMEFWDHFVMPVLDCLLSTWNHLPKYHWKEVGYSFARICFPRLWFSKERHWHQIWMIEEERPLFSGGNCCQMHGQIFQSLGMLLFLYIKTFNTLNTLSGSSVFLTEPGLAIESQMLNLWI